MDRDEWREPRDVMFIRNRDEPWDGETCPGYLVAQPQIHEAKAAAEARKSGCLPLYFPNATAPLLEAARLLQGAYAKYEADEIARKTRNQ